MNPAGAQVTALGARVHLFVRPEARERFTLLFRDVLGCDAVELDFGLAHPVLLVSFGDGSRFSVEFSDLAPEDEAGTTLDDQTAFRGAWIEFRTTDVPGYQRRLRGPASASSAIRAAPMSTSALQAARSSG